MSSTGGNFEPYSRKASTTTSTTGRPIWSALAAVAAATFVSGSGGLVAAPLAAVAVWVLIGIALVVDQGRASRISASMSRTAASMPVISARATRLWPILSSRTSAICTIGTVFW